LYFLKFQNPPRCLYDLKAVERLMMIFVSSVPRGAPLRIEQFPRTVGMTTNDRREISEPKKRNNTRDSSSEKKNTVSPHYRWMAV
jgi:hypothetical protein